MLDLSDNTVLVPTTRTLTVQDTRGGHYVQDAHYFYRKGEGEPGSSAFHPVLAAFRAGRIKPDGTAVEVVKMELDYPHRAYGRKVLEGTATYADGEQEEWRIQVDPVHMRFDWVRQPYNLDDALFFRIVTPRRTENLQLWHTGGGFQLSNGAVPQQGDAAELRTMQESELLFYSVLSKNCFRLELSCGGALHINATHHPGRTLGGEAGWTSREIKEGEELLWDARWVCDATALVHMAGSWGVVSAERDFVGRKAVNAVDASADFGPFYTQMLLGCLPLNLYMFEEGQVLARSSVLGDTGEEPEPAHLRELVWAAEFLYLVDPALIVDLLHAALDTVARRLHSVRPGTAKSPFSDEEAALVLLAAGRLHKLTGLDERLLKHLPLLRKCAQHILDLRRPNEAMPIVHDTWEPQGVIQGKEPYYVALCHAGLRRLAMLEIASGNALQARAWSDAARGMHFAATSPYLDGGLWHHEHGVFINYVDYRDPTLASPHDQNWSRSMVQQRPVVRPEYIHYETILPLWLGLVEGAETVRQAYSWIDGRYTYASGRGGVTFPPCVYRNFVALLDVMLRQKHGIPGMSRLLQLILDHAFDGGVPLTRAPFGTHAGGGRSSDQDDYGNFRHSRSGQLWDNSPYFGLVLNLHYGLDYSHEGWSIATPKPLDNYPLSRITNLRHKNAVYAITWQGRGRVKKIGLDGKTYRDNVLRAQEGEHEVVVYLT